MPLWRKRRAARYEGFFPILECQSQQVSTYRNYRQQLTPNTAHATAPRSCTLSLGGAAWKTESNHTMLGAHLPGQRCHPCCTLPATLRLGPLAGAPFLRPQKVISTYIETVNAPLQRKLVIIPGMKLCHALRPRAAATGVHAMLAALATP